MHSEFTNARVYWDVLTTCRPKGIFIIITMCVGVQADCGFESHFGFNGDKKFVIELCLREFSTHSGIKS